MLSAEEFKILPPELIRQFTIQTERVSTSDWAVLKFLTCLFPDYNALFAILRRLTEQSDSITYALWPSVSE